MHPATLARYGLRAEDAPYAEAWAAHAKRHNLDFEGGLRWYAESFRPGMSEVEKAQSFQAFAERNAWGDPNIATAEAFYNAVDRDGPGAIAPVQTNAAEDRAIIAEAQRLLKTDRSAYFKDGALQIQFQEAMARQGGNTPVTTFASPNGSPARGSNRKAELQAMIKDRRSDYYRPDRGGDQLQAEYRALLTSDQGGGGNQLSGPDEKALPL